MNSDKYNDAQKRDRIRSIFNDLSLCECGGSYMYEIIRDLLERAESKGAFLEPLGDRLNSKAVEFIANIMNSYHWDLLEHGISVRLSWLTERGELLLGFLRDFGTDPDAWPEWRSTQETCDHGRATKIYDLSVPEHPE
jgi:hypothetical protein